MNICVPRKHPLPTLMKLLAIRLSPQADKSLVISRLRERELKALPVR